MPESVVASEPAEHEPAAPPAAGPSAPEDRAPERWRAPVTVPLKALAGAAAGIAVAAVFFPLWVAVPVAVLLAAWSLGLCARRPAAILAGDLLTIRLGLVTRRLALSQVEAVVLDQGKVTIGKTDKSVISFYAWRRSRLDAWLKVPDVASDVAHAISKAATAAQAAAAQARAEDPSPAARSPKIRSGQNKPLIFLACAGVLEIAAAMLTRVSWGSPAMTAAGVVVALAFGFAGIGTLVFTLWTFLAGTRRR
jgi:hypothetical protein